VRETTVTRVRAGGRAHSPADSATILDLLPAPVVTLDAEDRITMVNAAAENFFSASASHLIDRPLSHFVPPDSPLHGLIAQVRRANAQVSEHELAIESPRVGRHFLSVQATPLPDSPGFIVLMMFDRGITEMIDRQMTHRGAARSITSMAAVLAHEVRNPLSGIRGAAQLLEQNASDEDRPLAELIRQEADRISTLIGRMEIFTDYGPFERKPVNIHKVLDRVQRLAETGFGANIRFRADFDPSLPPVPGDHDQLVQIFLNLVKNACDACPEVGGEINLRTSYQHGVRFALSGRKDKVALPLKVSIIDNGPGIPEDLTSNLFDPFVTSKPNGTGLGLALVAKLVGDHGGVVECESRPGRTEFRVMLPFYEDTEPGELK